MEPPIDTSDPSFYSHAEKLEDEKKTIEAMSSGLIPTVPDEPYEPDNMVDDTTKEEDGFEPCKFFFYGTLMDPVVLRAVAALDDLPELQEAWIQGFRLKMWHGRYPTLLPNQDSSDRIRGKTWTVTSLDQCISLQRYETSAYECSDCLVHGEDGQTAKALTFTWARDLDSSELSEGSFDLQHWQENHKTHMFS
jgi:hypothetical protein